MNLYINDNERTEFYGEIIDVFEDFLSKRGIHLPDSEKAKEENPDIGEDVVIAGSDYDALLEDLDIVCHFPTWQNKDRVN